MRFLSILARWLFILCLPILFLSFSISLAANSSWLYKYGFSKYNVGQTTGLAQAELEKAATGLISYFNSGEEHISLIVEKDGQPFELFNQREVLHLKDVKGLFHLGYWLLFGTLVYALGYAGLCLFWRRRKYWRKLAGGVVWGSGLTLGIMLLIGLGTLLNFDQLFWQFHILSFDNELWRLDPATDYLIMLFPQGFWFDVTVFCTLVTAALAIILGGVSGWYLTKSKPADSI